MTGLPLTSRLRKSQTSYPSNLEVPQENLGSPAFFPAAAVCPFFSRTEVLNSVSHRIIMIYTSLRCVLNISLSLIKIRSHLFGMPVLVCRTLEKASTLVQLHVRFKAQRKKKRKENTWEKTPKKCFLKNKLCWNYFAEMYLMKYLLGLKLINTSERVAYFTKIAGQRRRLVQQQTNKRQLSMSYQPIRSFAENSKQNHRNSPIFRLTLRLFRAGKQRSRNKATNLETGFPKILTKNMFSSHLKNCFCCHDKHKLLN